MSGEVKCIRDFDGYMEFEEKAGKELEGCEESSYTKGRERYATHINSSYLVGSRLQVQLVDRIRTRSNWLSFVEFSTSSKGTRIVPRSIYLSHQFSFHAFREDHHAIHSADTNLT
jgi:hypothetical protein